MVLHNSELMIARLARRIVAGGEPPHGTQSNRQTQPEPARGAGRKNDGAVKENEKQKRMPCGNQRPRPVAISLESAPPPEGVDDPAHEKYVVDVKPAAPVEAEHLGGLASRVAVGGSVAPLVIKMEGANHVSEQADAGSRPSQPCCCIPFISVAG